MPVLILDFYVDEPACFGVPPYLSPYCRYTAGALVNGGIPAEQIHYLTADAFREQNSTVGDEYEFVIIIAGATVPGKYLGGKLGTVAEILKFLEFRKKHQKKSVTLIGGPVKYVSPAIRREIENLGGILVRGDVELYAERYAKNPGDLARENPVFKEKRSYEEINRWAIQGAFLTSLHPNFPYLILEMETYRGCTRDVFCSFCSEAFYGKPVFRDTKAILDETEELYRNGNRYFRLGRQADLISYLPDMNDFKNSFPRPVPIHLENLYAGIRKCAPDLKMLHLDNINPGILATFPKESEKIIRIICKYNTPGDTAAMGIESVDDIVIKMNDLKSTEEESYRAIEMINRYGRERSAGIPHLLPGLNFIHGLAGENDGTFEKNYNFLKRIKEDGLLLRRINIRQATIHSKSKLERMFQGDMHKDKLALLQGIPGKHMKTSDLKKRFEYYRAKIRDEIDHHMLDACFPPGTIIEEVILESSHHDYILGRPLGSYPVTLKIPPGDAAAKKAFTEKKPIRVIITGARERSLSALSHPIEINRTNSNLLITIPGIGKKTAEKIFSMQPLKSYEDLCRITDNPVLSEKDFTFS